MKCLLSCSLSNADDLCPKSRSIRFHKLGGPEVLKFEETETPVPGKDQVRLRVEAVGLNHSEGAYFHGTYVEQPKLPSKLGYEAVGIVEAVGPGVDAGLIGKRLASIPGFSMNDYGVFGGAGNIAATCTDGLSVQTHSDRRRRGLDAIFDRLRRTRAIRESPAGGGTPNPRSGWRPVHRQAGLGG